MNKQNFSVDFQQIKLVGDIVLGNSQSNLLCLHGGGSLGKKRFDKLRERLNERNIGSCAFDFIGHGETGGDITSSSLESRVKQVLAVVKSQALRQPLSVIASSMSGYVSIKLTEFLDIENIALLAPAVYTSEAYSVSFGLRFSEIIRKPYSWRDSDVWKTIGNYTGNLLIFAAEKDQVIPVKVIAGIYNSALKASTKEIIMFKDATHPLTAWLDEHLDCLEQVSDKICDVIQN